MIFNTYTRKPFVVEAVEITDENIEDVAKMIGVEGEVREKDGAQYIVVDKRIVPNIHRASAGWWLTRMGDNLRCYSPKIFTEQFELASEAIAYEFKFNQPNPEPLLD
jgi:hypothetical protein